MQGLLQPASRQYETSPYKLRFLFNNHSYQCSHSKYKRKEKNPQLSNIHTQSRPTKIAVLFILDNLISYYIRMQAQEIVIQVTNPEQRSEIAGVNKFVVYQVKGSDSQGPIIINRRYSDFHLLREIMVKRWPGCYIPSLPEKKTIGSNETIFVESRRRGLEQFLETLALNNILWESEEVQLFLRSTSDSEKMLNPLLKQGPEKLFQRYQTLFGKFQDQKEGTGKILEFSSYLKDSKIVLDKLSEMIDKMHESTKRSLQKKLILVEFLLPDYEKNCLLENDEKGKVQNLLFLNSKTNGIAESIQKYKKLYDYPPVLMIEAEIKREKREIEAFEELIKLREEYEAHRQKSVGKVKDLELEASKINAGKQSLLSKIKKQSKESQLAVNEKELEKAKEEEANYTMLSRIITALIAHQEIDRFKQIRQKAYYSLLKKYAKEERDLADSQKDLWVHVGRHDWIALKEENNILGPIKREVEDFEGDLGIIGEETGEEEDKGPKEEEIL